MTVGTVTRAYGEAERRGLIGGEVGRGTFVRSDIAVRASIRSNAPVTSTIAAATAQPNVIDFSINTPTDLDAGGEYEGMMRADVARAVGFGQRRRAAQLPVQRRQPFASRSGRQAARAVRRAGRSRPRPHHRRRAARDHGGARRADRAGRHRADRKPDLARPAPPRRLPALPRARAADGQGRHPARRVRSRLPRPQHQGALLRHQPAEPDLDRGAGAAPARARRSRAALWREDRRGRRLWLPGAQRAAADGQFRAGARRVLQQRFQVDGAGPARRLSRRHDRRLHA